MQETEAYRKKRDSSDDFDREADVEAMAQLRKTKEEALTSMHRDIRDHASRIIESAQQAQSAYASTHRRARLDSIEEKGRAITAIIDIVSARQKP